MAHHEHRRAGALHLLLGEVGQLLHQVRPVAGDRVARVMAKAVHRTDLKTARTQVLEQGAVGACRKAVAVRKNKVRHGKKMPVCRHRACRCKNLQRLQYVRATNSCQPLRDSLAGA